MTRAVYEKRFFVLYILSGQDDFSLSQSLEGIKKGIGDQATLAINTSTLDGHEVTLDQLKTVCETVPFLAEKRLVIVSGLLERFEPKRKANRRKKTKQLTDQNDEYKSFSSYISQIPESAVLVLIESGAGSNNPLLRELSGKAEIRLFPLLRDSKLRQWIQQRVSKEGGTISPQAVDSLAALVGNNLWIMASEINKLVLFTSGRRIEESDVSTVVSYAQQANVFAMVDAIIELKGGVAEQLMQQLLQQGVAPAYLLVMLSRQLNLIVRGKELKSQGKPGSDIQNRLGLSSEFVLRKTLEQADRYSWGRVKEVYQRLLEADLSIKTGKYDGELALNILIADLCQQRKT
jgi:DNA polymerase-3 subunit delta